MSLRKDECEICKRQFAAKTIQLEKTKVPAGVEPPCRWEPIKVELNGYRFTMLKPPSLREEDFIKWWRAEGGDAFSRMEALSSLVLCPSCGCWAHVSSGINLRCANCGRFFKKVPKKLGRRPYPESLRKLGLGTYRRKSGDLRWVRE